MPEQSRISDAMADVRLWWRRRRWAVAAIGYFAMALFTFGHSASAHQRFIEANCLTAEQRVERGRVCYGSGGPEAFGAAMAWPFYWAWEAQS